VETRRGDCPVVVQFRLALGFSKKLANLEAAVTLYLAY
jgi:hypothetical protein